MMDIIKNQSLKSYNTFGLDATAQNFAEAKSVDDLKAGLQFAKDNQLPIMILGGGSNVLFGSDFEGLILINSLRGIESSNAADGSTLIRSAAGENWHQLVLHCVENGWGGIENMSLIPGSVGAAPLQNIGAYGVELKDVFVSLEALNLKTLEIETFDHSACQFGYRDSYFKNEGKGRYWVTSVTLRLNETGSVNTSYGAIEQTLNDWGITSPSIADVSKAVIHIRSERLPDPAVLGNSGSFFKNPIIPVGQLEQLKQQHPDIPSYPVDDQLAKLPAAWLIEQSGWKGKRVGNTGSHAQQALVLVNYGDATGSEILNLSAAIQASVFEKFGVVLDREVNLV